VGWTVCADALVQEEPREVFAAAVLAFESGQDQRIKMVLEAAATDLELSRGVISALDWLRFETALDISWGNPYPLNISTRFSESASNASGPPLLWNWPFCSPASHFLKYGRPVSVNNRSFLV
jgi:hypothetical protein